MQWFVKEQVEEVALMQDLLNVVERSKDNLLWSRTSSPARRSARTAAPTPPPRPRPAAERAFDSNPRAPLVKQLSANR